jgi:anti-sigma B factor antagonist
MALGDQPAVVVTGTPGATSTPVISLAGELDLASLSETRTSIEPFLADHPDRVTFDLEHLTFMDSSGIALLVEIGNTVPQVALTNVQPIVHRILEATGLLTHFGLD